MLKAVRPHAEISPNTGLVEMEMRRSARHRLTLVEWEALHCLGNVESFEKNGSHRLRRRDSTHGSRCYIVVSVDLEPKGSELRGNCRVLV